MAGGCQARAEWVFAAVLQSVLRRKSSPWVQGRREAEHPRPETPSPKFPAQGRDEGKPLRSPRCPTHRREVAVLINLG